MKRHHIIIAVILLFMPFVAGADVLKGSYFLDNSVNRHVMNPAFSPRANYFHFGGLGNTTAGVYSNLDVPTFLYPMDGGLATFLHPSVTLQQFEQSLATRPYVDAEMSTSLLGIGFTTKNKGYWTFDLSMQTGIDVDLPRDFFVFLKKGAGTQGQSFNIANINAYATGSVSAALGYSRDIIDGLRVGAKVRLIAPLAYAGLNLENMRINTAKDKWLIQTEGYAYVAMQGFESSIPEGETVPELDFDVDRMLENQVVDGVGYSVDLGVEYKLNVGSFLDGLTVSAAVTDLGKIFYEANSVSAYSAKGEMEWTGFQGMSADNVDFDAIMDDFVDAAGELISMKEEKMSSFTRSTMPRVYAGIEYPFLRRTMSVGLLYSGRFSHSYYRQELTASYNLKPLKWFALGVNYSFLNSNKTMGAILEFTPRAGINLCIGYDYFPVSYAPIELSNSSSELMQGFTPAIPMSMRFNMHFGLSLALGGDKYRK